jgi:hypothetical protein
MQGLRSAYLAVDDGQAQGASLRIGATGRMPARHRGGSLIRSEVPKVTGRQESPVAEMPVERFPARSAKGFAPERSGEMTGGCSRMPVRAPATDPTRALRCAAGKPPDAKCPFRRDHASVRVGSAAMPAPFALPPRFCSAPLSRVAAPRKATPGFPFHLSLRLLPDRPRLAVAKPQGESVSPHAPAAGL